MHAYVYIDTHASTHILKHIHTYIHAHMHTDTHACIHIHVQTQMYVCVIHIYALALNKFPNLEFYLCEMVKNHSFTETHP